MSRARLHPCKAPSDASVMHFLWFDGGNTTGWAYLAIRDKAFSRPEHKVLANLIGWDCGELSGTETDVFKGAVQLLDDLTGIYGANASFLRSDVGGEDFDLVQLTGHKDNLLSPVRFNAVIGWESRKRGLTYGLQNRQERRVITGDILRAAGFPGRWTDTSKGRNAFAAMQHVHTRVRKVKALSKRNPWKLSEGNIINGGGYDCACQNPERQTPRRRKFGGYPCDLVHPK